MLEAKAIISPSDCPSTSTSPPTPPRTFGPSLQRFPRFPDSLLASPPDLGTHPLQPGRTYLEQPAPAPHPYCRDFAGMATPIRSVSARAASPHSSIVSAVSEAKATISPSDCPSTSTSPPTPGPLDLLLPGDHFGLQTLCWSPLLILGLTLSCPLVLLRPLAHTMPLCSNPTAMLFFSSSSLLFFLMDFPSLCHQPLHL